MDRLNYFPMSDGTPVLGSFFGEVHMFLDDGLVSSEIDEDSVFT